MIVTVALAIICAFCTYAVQYVFRQSGEYVGEVEDRLNLIEGMLKFGRDSNDGE